MESLPFEMPEDLRKRFEGEFKDTWKRYGTNDRTHHGLALDMFENFYTEIAELTNAAHVLGWDLVELTDIHTPAQERAVGLYGVIKSIQRILHEDFSAIFDVVCAAGAYDPVIQKRVCDVLEQEPESLPETQDEREPAPLI